jgi:putative NIF3 family GTP cyclohydrolase 1 type 2
VLVVGEIKHHEINFANEAGINIIDAGHFKSEDIVISPLIKHLSTEFPNIIFTKSKAYSDKIKFA